MLLLVSSTWTCPIWSNTHHRIIGNGGTANGTKVTNVQIGVSEFDKLTEFAIQNKVCSNHISTIQPN